MDSLPESPIPLNTPNCRGLHITLLLLIIVMMI